MKKGVLFYSAVIFLPFLAIIICLQWLLVSPYEPIYLFEKGKLKSYIWDKKTDILVPQLNVAETYLKMPVLRKTDKTISVASLDGYKQYLYDKNLSTYRLVQESKVKYTTPKNVAVLYIATGKYIVFWENFYKQTEKYFLPRHKKTYFLFTDHDDLKVPENVVKIHQDQLPWPYVTFKRFHFFEGIEKELKKFDYVYFLNGTMLPTKEIHEEIFPTKEQGVMVTLHPGYWSAKNKRFPYDRNPKSKAYIPNGHGIHYFMGGFNGGTSEAFLKLIKTCREWSDIDMKNNQMPAWHDESMLNAYILNEIYRGGGYPLILFPEYAIPQDSGGWGLDELYPYEKMIIINKQKHGGHAFLRGQSDDKK